MEASGGGGSPFSFTIDYSLLNAEVRSAWRYHSVLCWAQDLATTPNVAINSGTFNSQPSSVALTGSALPDWSNDQQLQHWRFDQRYQDRVRHRVRRLQDAYRGLAGWRL